MSKIPMLKQVLASDHTPTVAELSSVHAEIEQDTAELNHLEACISYLQATLSQAQAKRDATARRLEMNKSVDAPIRKLPHEILGLIFCRCLMTLDFTQYASKSQIGSHCAPMLFTRVCRKWRKVAFGTPRLWTVLDIGRDSMRQLNLPVVIPFWFECSGSLLLDVRFDLTFNGLEQLYQPFLSRRTSRIIDTLSLIRNNFDRCRALVLGLDVSCGIPIRRALFTSSPRPRMSSLEALIINAGGWDLCQLGNIDAPKLRLLCIEGCMCDLPRLRNSFSSSRPTTDTLVFTNADTNVRQLVTFIGTWSALINCHIGITVLDPSLVDAQSPIFLPSLRSLHIDWFRNIDPITSFLGAFFAPSLQSLELHYENEFEEDCGIINFADLMGNEPCRTSWTWSLKELKLAGMDTNESRVVLLLRSCPNLERLRLRWCEGTEKLLRALGGACFTGCQDEEEGCLMACCWKLASLELEGVFEVAGLRSIIDLRAGSRPPMVSCDEERRHTSNLKQVIVVVEIIQGDIIALKTTYPDIVTIVQGCMDCGLTEPGEVVKRYL